jgi:hypothetical protein
MNKAIALGALLTLGACATPTAAGGRALTFHEGEVTTLEGTLVEARCYLNTGWCSSRAPRAGSPSTSPGACG